MPSITVLNSMKNALDSHFSRAKSVIQQSFPCALIDYLHLSIVIYDIGWWCQLHWIIGIMTRAAYETSLHFLLSRLPSAMMAAFINSKYGTEVYRASQSIAPQAFSRCDIRLGQKPQVLARTVGSFYWGSWWSTFRNICCDSCIMQCSVPEAFIYLLYHHLDSAEGMWNA